MPQNYEDYPESYRNLHRAAQQNYARSQVVGQAGRRTSAPVPTPTRRTVGGINPSTDNRFQTLRSLTGLRGGSTLAAPTGTQISAMDPELQAEIDYYRRAAQLDLAEHEQAVRNADREAENRRIPVRRNIDIQDIYRQRMPGAISDEYGQLDRALASVIPLTQQAYDEGVHNILADYGLGVQNQQALSTSADPLAAQLQQMAGRTDNFEQGVEGSSEMLANLLAAASSRSAQALAGEGAGTMAAINASLPGYAQERDQSINMEGLSSDAERANLLQQLALIQPDFIPFNYGELMNETDRHIADAMARAADRAREEEEANRKTYSGREGVNMFALERDRPQLATAFSNLLSQARMQSEADPEAALYALINNYSDPSIPPLPAFQRTPIYETLNPSGSLRGMLGGANPRRLTGYEPLTPQQQQMVDERQQRKLNDQELLRTLYDIYLGNYSNA